MKKNWGWWVLVVAVAGIIGYQQIQISKLSGPQGEGDKIIAAVGMHYALTGGPYEVRRLQDVATLAEQDPFYKQAEDGDYLVITTQRAILYDSDRDRIVDVVPVQRKPSDKAKEELKEVVESAAKDSDNVVEKTDGKIDPGDDPDEVEESDTEGVS